MAAAYVSGAAALLVAANPSLSVAQIIAVLTDTVDRVPQYAGKIASGGRLNLDKALLQVAGAAQPSRNPSGTVHTLTFSATPASPLPVHATISMTAAATDIPAEYQFQMLTVRWYGFDYTVLQPYSTNATLTWRPASPGAYYLRVLARAAGSTSRYDVMRSIPVTVRE